MEMEKKNVAIIVLVIALVASGIGNIFLIIPYLTVTAPANVTYIRATGAGPHTLDPMNSWDSASNDVIDQVCEALFAYNFTDLAMPRYNELAETYFWASGTELQIKLREDITFHDGYAFNATVVKWNFDRLNYLCGIVDGPQDRMIPFNDTKPSTTPAAEASSLYFLPDGKPIFNRTVVVSEYNVTIYLNEPFAAFLDLLCFQASYMVSPLSTPATAYIELYERVIGTGPYKFVSFTSGVEVRFERNDNYWQPRAFFQYVVFALMASATARSNAMLAHQVDAVSGPLSSLIPTFDADPTITVDYFTDRTGITSLAYYYLGLNNNLLNVTWRKAISYAINYTYINKNVYNDLVVRANSPIAPGYGDAYNASVTAASYDLTIARQTMVSMGFGDMGWTTAQWRAATPFMTVNYSYNTDNQNRADISPLVTTWLRDIGIEVLDDGITWDAFLDKLYVFHDQLGIYWVGWGPDYLDPFNMLDPLFNPASSSDSAQVDDAYLNAQLALALATTDDVARNNIYKHIQWYLVESQYVHAFGMHPKLTSVYDSHIHGVALNAKQDLYLYSIYRS
jgi:peptide/nickel transport system substrate-binding protein